MPKGKKAKRQKRADKKAAKKPAAKGKKGDDDDDDGDDDDDDKGKGRKGKPKKDKGDREDHITDSMSSSSTMEEALLKCCSHYDMEGSGVSAEKACDGVVARRQAQMEACKKEFEDMVKLANTMFVEICSKDSSYKVSPAVS